MPDYPATEILEVHAHYLAVRERIEQQELGWDALAQFFTDDASFVDPAWGRVDGIANIKTFLIESMVGLEDWSFPARVAGRGRQPSRDRLVESPPGATSGRNILSGAGVIAARVRRQR